MQLGQGDRGYAMAALLVGLSIMAVLMSAALPVWSHYTKREREEELIWRGQQYARAIGLFQRKYANTFPPNLEILLEQKFLRKKYKDPTNDEDFQLIPVSGPAAPGPGGAPPAQGGIAGQPPPSPLGQPSRAGVPSFQPAIGIQGVVSKNKNSSIKIFNGRSKYNEWMFVYLASAQRIGPGGAQAQQPGQINLGGSPFTPLGGSPRRPGLDGQPPSGPGGQRQPPFPPGQSPFQPGQSPFQPGQSPFAQPQPPPFGPGGRGPAGQPARPPG